MIGHLPAELRNRVYGYTLIYGILELPSWSLWGRLPLLDVGLLRTCRQIHMETVLLLYRFNNFRLEHNMDLDMLTTCLNEEKRSVVRRLDMDRTPPKRSNVRSGTVMTVQSFAYFQRSKRCMFGEKRQNI
jgi:hypothetical protein